VLTQDKEADAIIAPLLKCGWTLENGTKHLKLSSPRGDLITVSKTSSDIHYIDMLKRDIRRVMERELKKGKVISRNRPCKCGNPNSLELYADYTGYCYACKQFYQLDIENDDSDEATKLKNSMGELKALLSKSAHGMTRRKLLEAAINAKLRFNDNSHFDDYLRYLVNNSEIEQKGKAPNIIYYVPRPIKVKQPVIPNPKKGTITMKSIKVEPPKPSIEAEKPKIVESVEVTHMLLNEILAELKAININLSRPQEEKTPQRRSKEFWSSLVKDMNVGETRQHIVADYEMTPSSLQHAISSAMQTLYGKENVKTQKALDLSYIEGIRLK
jgi:hypothetical protein